MSKLYVVLDSPYLNRLSEFPANGFDGIREGALEFPYLFPNKPVLKANPAYPYDVTTGGAAVDWTLFDQQCQGVKAAGIDLLLTSFYNGYGGDWDAKAKNAIGNDWTYVDAAHSPQSPTDYGLRHPSPKDVAANVLCNLARISRAINYHGLPPERVILDGWNEYQELGFGGQGSAMQVVDGTGAYAGMKVGNYTRGATKGLSTYMQFEVQQFANALIRAVKAAFPSVKVCAPSLTHDVLDTLPATANIGNGAQVGGIDPANVIDPLTGSVADCFAMADFLNVHCYIHAGPGASFGIDQDTGDARVAGEEGFGRMSLLRESVLAHLEACIAAAEAIPALAGKRWCVSEFGQSYDNYGGRLNRFFIGEALDEFAQTYELHPRVDFAVVYVYVGVPGDYGLIPTSTAALYIGNGGAYDQGKHDGYYRIRERRRGTPRASTVTYPNSQM